MAVGTVGIMSPGDMGSGVGGALKKNGLTVLRRSMVEAKKQASLRPISRSKTSGRSTKL